jgi:hypothetical protein
MKPPVEPRRRELLLAALAMLSGCGGVDSGGTGTGAASTFASGAITGFGSIIVNGVRYDDTSAAIEDDDGRVRSRDELKLGMRAEVLASAVSTVGSVASATASSIRLRSEIVGPLESVDVVNARLSVLGQTVSVVATTVFDTSIAAGLASIAPGDLLEIYATLDVAAGRYVASRMERRASAAAYKLHGAVASLSLAAKTIAMGRLVIDWSTAAPADPGTALAVGRLVRVVLSTTPLNGVWRATSLTSDQLVQPDRDLAEVEGRITAFTSAGSFALDGLPVDASTASFPNGSAGLALGAKVEAQGRLSAGILVATRVAVEAEDGGPDPFELHGRIDSVDVATQRFVVRGVTVVWSATTRFESSTAADIKVGRTAEVKGGLSPDGQLIEATSVQVE